MQGANITVPIRSTSSGSVTGSLTMQFKYIAINNDPTESNNSINNNNNVNINNNMNIMNRLPKGASPGALNWADLVSTLKSSQFVNPPLPVPDNSIGGSKPKSLQVLESLSHLDGMHQICSVDNVETDTQAGVWMDIRRRQVV